MNCRDWACPVLGTMQAAPVPPLTWLLAPVQVETMSHIPGPASMIVRNLLEGIGDTQDQIFREEVA